MTLLERLRSSVAVAGLSLTMLPSAQAIASAGALDIYVLNTPPGADKVSNGLLAPTGVYDLITRIYGPDQSVLDGAWKFPELQKC